VTEPSDDRRKWIAPLAISIVCCLAMPLVWPIPSAIDYLIGIAGFSALLALWFGLIPRLRRDPYDLEALRRVHEREELMELDPGDVSYEADKVVCANCGRSYHVRFPICPHCRCR